MRFEIKYGNLIEYQIISFAYSIQIIHNKFPIK